MSVNEADVKPSKLSPDLEAAVKANARFLGLTYSGEAVLDLLDNLMNPLQEARAKLRDEPGVGRIELFSALPPAADAHDPSMQDPFDRTDELVVTLSSRTLVSPDKLAGLPVVDRHEYGRLAVVRSVGGFSPQQLRDLSSLEQVELIEPSYQYRLLSNNSPPDDPEFVMGRLWGLSSIHAPDVWQNANLTGSSATVAIIDSGIDTNHEDLNVPVGSTHS